MRRSLRAVLVGGYEERVRLFLGLIVFVLAATNTASFLFLRSQAILIRDSTEEIVTVRGALAANGIAHALEGVGGARKTLPAEALEPRIDRIAGEAGIRGLSLLDATGRVIASSDHSPEGSADPDAALGLGLVPDSAPAAAVRPSSRILDRGAVMVRLEAIAPRAGGRTYLVKSVHDTDDLAAAETAYHRLIWAQMAAVLVVLFSAVVFGRWISRPYRLIAQEAGAADLLGDAAEPENLVAAFRRVVAKMREQDEELRTLHREAESGADIRQFADGVASGMTSGLIALDRAGGFVAANPAAGRILGWSAAPPAGAPIESWAGPDSALRRLLAESLAGAPPKSRVVIEHRRGTGSPGEAHLGVAVSPIVRRRGKGPEGRPEGILCLIADLTDVRELEDTVRRRESLAALGAVSAGIAHEIRNALGTILGYARLAERASAPPVSEHARAIAREVEVVGKMVEDFLRFARPSRLVFVPVDLRGLLQQVVDDAGHAGLLETMTVEITGEPGTILCDEQALRQAFANLVRNAAQSADRTVHLRIVAERDERGVSLTFRDDGDGIPAEHLDRIFLPFFTTRGTGTGIGLAMTQKAVLDHEGAIQVEVPPEGGTAFRVTLPTVH